MLPTDNNDDIVRVPKKDGRYTHVYCIYINSKPYVFQLQDTGDFGKVTYRIVGEGSEVFTIHPEEGHIQVSPLMTSLILKLFF